MLNIFSYSNADKLSVKSLAIGCFDALHLGHFKLIDALCKNGALLVVNKHLKRQIVPYFLKEKIAQKDVFFVDFRDIKDIEGDEFLLLIKQIFPNLNYFVAGYDFTFGKDKKYNANDISKLCNIKTKIIPEYVKLGISVHSKNIYELLNSGKIATANKLLGRKYFVMGDIICGQGLGERFFVPTINIVVDNFVLPKEGVYLSECKLNNKIYKSVSFIGRRSTDGKIAFETHILDDFNELDIKFTKTMSVFLLDFLRENKHFDDFSSLKNQILNDINLAKKFHNN